MKNGCLDEHGSNIPETCIKTVSADGSNCQLVIPKLPAFVNLTMLSLNSGNMFGI